MRSVCRFIFFTVPYSSHESDMLQLRLGCHGLPGAAGRLGGAGDVDRAHNVCLLCSVDDLGDDKHLGFERTAHDSLRVTQRYADLFTDGTDTMQPFSAQSDHPRVYTTS